MINTAGLIAKCIYLPDNFRKVVGLLPSVVPPPPPPPPDPGTFKKRPNLGGSPRVVGVGMGVEAPPSSTVRENGWSEEKKMEKW